MLFTWRYTLRTVASTLFQIVRQIHWVEVVAFLVWFIDLSLLLLMGLRQLDEFFLVDVKVVGRVVVIWRHLHTIVYDLAGG